MNSMIWAIHKKWEREFYKNLLWFFRKRVCDSESNTLVTFINKLLVVFSYNVSKRTAMTLNLIFTSFSSCLD